MLPFSYNEDRVFLYPIDPSMLFGYWDFNVATWERVRNNPHWPLVLLLMSDEQLVRRVETSKEAKSFYFRGTPPDTKLQLILALHEDGRDVTLLRSPYVLTPPYSPSPRMDVEFARLNIHESLPVPSWKESLRRREAQQQQQQHSHHGQVVKPWEPVPDWQVARPAHAEHVGSGEYGHDYHDHHGDETDYVVRGWEPEEDSLPDYLPPSSQGIFPATYIDPAAGVLQGQLPVPRPAWFSGLSNLFPTSPESRLSRPAGRQDNLGGNSSGVLAGLSSTTFQQPSSHVLSKGERK